MKKIIKHLKNVIFFYSSFSGKAGRGEFIIYSAIATLLGFLALNLHKNINLNNEKVLNFFYICFIILFAFIPYQAATARRLNDIGIKPSWIILNFIPIIGTLFKIYLCFENRKKQTN
ncbi:DUF805 domain-containing protein [Flavobacterium sp. 1355]|jgi:uncharacterized membrane protein YhaH (DUF805 family)|uniref:DUF805 domain-containing protein n=1 Tax=Flavobacterium sp. 1355 TaxID=2806571 RepID=UPI001AE6648A|nr:DUF805 domain-containing protein [Flavobacterium sp. 1355]MBP1224603.1 uncharacterized membrane protein YhaH (DUF805 family) [Flavobacterium sp. 1355]